TPRRRASPASAPGLVGDTPPVAGDALPAPARPNGAAAMIVSADAPEDVSATGGSGVGPNQRHPQWATTRASSAPAPSVANAAATRHGHGIRPAVPEDVAGPRRIAATFMGA